MTLVDLLVAVAVIAIGAWRHLDVWVIVVAVLVAVVIERLLVTRRTVP
jgi:hypothetical protein